MSHETLSISAALKQIEDACRKGRPPNAESRMVLRSAGVTGFCNGSFVYGAQSSGAPGADRTGARVQLSGDADIAKSWDIVQDRLGQ